MSNFVFKGCSAVKSPRGVPFTAPGSRVGDTTICKDNVNMLGLLSKTTFYNVSRIQFKQFPGARRLKKERTEKKIPTK